MKGGRAKYVALVCAAALCLSGCDPGALADGSAGSGSGMAAGSGATDDGSGMAADGGSADSGSGMLVGSGATDDGSGMAAVGGSADSSSGMAADNGQIRESTDNGERTSGSGGSASDGGDRISGSGENLNALGLDAEAMDIFKYNVYVELNNTVVEIMNNISSYFLVVDTAETFRFREDATYAYGWRIRGIEPDAVEDARLVSGMEPAYETLDGLVEAMLPSLCEIMETFNAMGSSEDTYGESHTRLMAHLEEFTAYANEYLDQFDVIADERNAVAEEKMLAEGRLILYSYSRMLTVSSCILDEIYNQGIDDYNLTELDLVPIYPMVWEMRETAAACDEAVSDSSQLAQEALSGRQVYPGYWDSLLQAFEEMVSRVESGVPNEDPFGGAPGSLQYIYEVLSDRVRDYNSIFTESGPTG